jgi:hypothetical protein
MACKNTRLHNVGGDCSIARPFKTKEKEPRYGTEEIVVETCGGGGWSGLEEEEEEE